MSALDRIPGLAGYLAARQQNEGATLNQLQQAGAVMALQQTMRQGAREQDYRNALASAATDEERMAVAAKFASPDKLLDIKQRSEDRRAAAEDRASQFAQTLGMRQQALDQQKELFLSRTEDARARQAFEEYYKRQQLSMERERNQVNAQLRTLGLEIQRQGQNLQVERFNVAERDRRDKQVTAFANELQQNKIPALSAAITNANSLLSQYEDKPIPGIGALEGSDKIPNLMRSEESKKVRGSLQAVSNDLLNLYSGLAVTLPEAERRQLEEMRRGDFTEADFRNAWPNIVNRFNSVVGNLRAGSSPEVLREYQSRPGAISLEPLKPAFALPTVKNDEDYNKLPSGAKYIDPEGKRRTKR